MDHVKLREFLSTIEPGVLSSGVARATPVLEDPRVSIRRQSGSLLTAEHYVQLVSHASMVQVIDKHDQSRAIRVITLQICRYFSVTTAFIF